MRISQFQKYSQRENTVTNNVLLMLSRLNDLNMKYFKSIIERLNEGNEKQSYYPQPIFSQQIWIGNGVIDGQIEVKPSKIIIETKLSHTEFIGKLVKYGKVFNANSQNQLWHLSSVRFNEYEIDKINKHLNELYPEYNIQFNSLLFSDIIENIEGIYEENYHDMELKLLLEDFSNYCHDGNLISNEDFKLLFVPTGFSFNWNKKHKIYYCPVSWHSQKFKYFGLYKEKSVRTISTIEAIIIADFDNSKNELTIYSKNHSEEQINRLKSGLAELGKNQIGLKYYILPIDEFYETKFRKVSHGGIQGYRYKDLRDYITLDDYNNLEVIANKLKGVTWR